MHRSRIATEALAWMTMSAAFLAVCIARFGDSPSIIASHLFIVGAIWGGGIGARALVAQLFATSRATPYVLSALTLLPWLLMLCWYGLALVGLFSWGRVTTWPIIQTYGSQAPFLLTSLGLPGWLLWAPPGLVLLAIALLGRTRWARPDWPATALAGASPARRWTLSLLLAAAPWLLFAMMWGTAPLDPDEPLQLSLFPSLSEQKESNAFSVSPAVNARESRAREAYVPGSPAGQRNVILIVGDALRADHMSTHGYPRPTTPFLDSLVQSGAAEVLPRVRAACAESVCGYMSLAASRPLQSMPSRPLILPEVLRRNGYAAHLVFSGDHTNFYGLRDFYGEVDSYHDGSTIRYRGARDVEHAMRYMNDDEYVLDRIKQFPRAAPGKPIFLQIVLMSSHGLGLRHPGSESFQPSYNYYRLFGRSARKTSASTLEAVVNFYDNGVLQFDSYVGRLLSTLGQKGYLDDALVVVTGDHGEMLGEHGLLAHGVGVHEPVLNIPLLLARYGYQAPARLPQRKIASQIDIAPTILAELGLPIPPTWAGEPLQRPDRQRPIYFQQVGEAGLYEDRGTEGVLKYWHNFRTGEDFLFDIEKDPQETRNLAKQVSPASLSAWRMQVAHGGLQVGRGARDLRDNQTITRDTR